jgi:muramoyltetrapeptide carboxypeptidase
MKRRNFISQLGIFGGIGIAGNTLLAKDIITPNSNQISLNNSLNNSFNNLEYPDKVPQKIYQHNEIIKPRALKRGDTIAITAPASPTSLGEIAATVKLFKNLGFNVVVGDTIKNQNINFRYLSDDDEKRATELMNFVIDENVNAIICGRGGYGVMRTFPYLDFTNFTKNPKIIVGFSDITALLLAINKKSNLVCFHGPVATTKFDAFTFANFTKILFDEQQFTKIETYLSEMTSINEGVASGVVTGGNLKLIVSTLGTPYEINTDNTILFIEEINEHPYEIDRMITQLVLSEKLNNVKGIVFGKFNNPHKRMPFHPFAQFTIVEIIEQLLKPFNIPIVYNIPFGHTDIMLTLPIGIKVELNTKNKSLTFLEPSVSII